MFGLLSDVQLRMSTFKFGNALRLRVTGDTYTSRCAVCIPYPGRKCSPVSARLTVPCRVLYCARLVAPTTINLARFSGENIVPFAGYQ